MRLNHATWPEVEAYPDHNTGIIVPVGSTEQHGPMGLIGTDALCAQSIARRVARAARAYVAPVIAYTPAPFNTGFYGTVSICETLFESLIGQIFAGLRQQGFRRIYVMNGHGANMAPMQRAARGLGAGTVLLRNWWDFTKVNALRRAYYGDWEGMHATPSEVAITQTLVRVVPPGEAAQPPQKLSRAYIAAHSGDRHGPADEHRAAFPDGRVGSHSALARPAHGPMLLDAAVGAATQDYLTFTGAVSSAGESA